MTLLLPEDQRDSPEGLLKALSEYYNSPGSPQARPRNIRKCLRGLVGVLPDRRQLRLQTRTFGLFREGDSCHRRSIILRFRMI